jgi:rhamnosyltransferase
MKATLLIRCLNEINNLKILFPILEAQEDPNFEIVFIDSGSTDGSYEYVKNYDSKIPIILAKIDKAEFSFGKSLNMAAEKSTFKNILISLSAHCFPTDNMWFKNIISEFNNPKVRIVFGKQIGDKKSVLSESAHLNSWFGNKSGLRSSPFINNGNSAFRYETWESFKFNEDLTGCEDIDFAQRVINTDGLIYYSSDSVVTHYHNEDIRQIRNRYRRESQALRNIFIDDIEFSLLDLMKSTFKETYSDIQFKKENIFPKSNLFNILIYRYNKNLGHYMGINHPLESTKVIQNNYYSYSDSKIYYDNFKKDYFYK